jgi:hypothetical protein
MRKIYSVIFTALAVTMSFGQTFTGTYTFASVTTTSGLTDPTPVPTVTGVTFGSFSAANPVATNPGANGRFVFDNQPLGASNGATYAALTGSVSATTYYEVTLTPQAGYSVDLTSITFTTQRSNTGVRTYVVRSSADSFVANLPASISPANANLIAQPGDIFFFNADNNASQTGSTITLSGVNFTDLTLPITFRFYAYNAEGTGGNFSIDDVVVSGNINTLSIADNNIEGLKMYPNPVSGNTLYLTSTNNLNMSVQIFDLLGKEVIKSNVINNAITISSLSSGIYVVKISEEGKTATRKLVIN